MKLFGKKMKFKGRNSLVIKLVIELVIGTFTIFQPIESLYRSFYSEIQNVKVALKHNSDRITKLPEFLNFANRLGAKPVYTLKARAEAVPSS